MTRLRRFLSMRLADKLSLIQRAWVRLKGILYYRHVFKSFGRGSSLDKPLLLGNPHLIEIGERVHIRPGVRLEAVACDATYEPQLRIGDDVRIEQFVQITSVGKIIIHAGVCIGCGSVIVCASHPFLDAENPVKIGDRVAGKTSVIEIGEGALIGAGVAILPNVRIGKRAVIGANAVVKGNIPDYGVAEGNPAKVVMFYDKDNGKWQTAKR